MKVSRGADSLPSRTPEYFQSDPGWTDAEWHAALFTDPDNRKGNILPLLAADCPYIPVLLRHLEVIDIRGNKFQEGLQLLLRILREDPLPRPTTYNGQLITPFGHINRATLLAERAIPEGDPTWYGKASIVICFLSSTYQNTYTGHLSPTVCTVKRRMVPRPSLQRRNSGT